MKKIIGIIFFCFCCCIAAMAQDEPENNDTLSLTEITTTDILQTMQTGKIKWTAVTTTTYQAKWCLFGKCADDNLGITHIVESCCTFGQWIRKLFGGGKGSTTTLTQNTDSGGGTSGTGGEGNSNNSGGSGSIPPGPTTPPLGTTGGTTNTPPGYGTTPTNTFTTTITTPPPIKPATALDNGDMEEDSTALVKKDTVQPVKVPCNSAATARGKYADSIWNALDSTTEKKRLIDSAKNGKYESAFQIKKNAQDSLITFNFTTSNSSMNVDISVSDNDTLYGGAHCHSDKEGINSQSPSDLFRLLNMFKQQKTYKIDFLYSFDNTEWAITIGDSLSALSFINNDSTYAFNKLVDTSSAAGDYKGYWSRKNKNPVTRKTYYDEYNDIGWKLAQKNYPDEVTRAYANMIMINKIFNTGIKVLKKVGNSFKELSFEVHKDSLDNETYTIKICE